MGLPPPDRASRSSALNALTTNGTFRAEAPRRPEFSHPEARRRSGRVRRVKDTGHGISAEHINRMALAAGKSSRASGSVGIDGRA
jgi:hypothetical protein